MVGPVCDLAVLVTEHDAPDELLAPYRDTGVTVARMTPRQATTGSGRLRGPLGFLAGPASIGSATDATSLPWALSVLVMGAVG